MFKQVWGPLPSGKGESGAEQPHRRDAASPASGLSQAGGSGAVQGFAEPEWAEGSRGCALEGRLASSPSLSWL